MSAVGIERKSLQVSEKAVDRMIEEYTREAGVRGLKKRIDQLCRIAAVSLVENPEQSVSVTENIMGNLRRTEGVGESCK